MTRRAAAALALLAVLLFPPGAPAQEGEGSEGLGTPDSVFEEQTHNPISWQSNYNRDRATGTWMQTLAYGMSRGRVTFDLTGSATNVDDILRAGVGGQSGNLAATLNLRLRPRWVFGARGRFTSDKFGQTTSGTRQRTDRVHLHTQYSATPLRNVTLSALLSTEFQQDRSLSFRPILSGFHVDSSAAPPDSYRVYAQRDSSVLEGRLDGASAQLDWKPVTWMGATLLANGSRSRPVTRTFQTEHTIPPSGSGQRDFTASEPPHRNPIDNSLLQGRLSLTRLRGLRTVLSLKRLETEEEYYDRLLRGQERSALNQRAASLQAVGHPLPGLELSASGTVSRTLKEFRLRRTSTSLVTSRDADLYGIYARPESRASLRVQLSRARNDRQTAQNGLILSRFVTATAARRVSSRLWLDGMGSASLFSYRYDYPAGAEPLANDRDNARAAFNLGGGYRVSDRCSTTVHFSSDRSHAVAVGAGASSNNLVQTNYQMNATLSLRPTRRLVIEQGYLLSAVYQIYDYLEERNILSRIKRIDTTVTDSLLPFLGLGLTHNFLFRDVGPFVPDTPGGKRLFTVTTETYQQNLAVKLGLRPARGVLAFATQNLTNTRDYQLSANTQSVSNRWTLTLGGELRRELPGNANLEATVQRIGAYTERPSECGGPNPPASCAVYDRREEDYWLVTAALQKEF